MAKRKITKTVDNWKKKKWQPIIATKLFREALIGETLIENPQDLIGKTITQNMMALTNDIKKKDTEIAFKIIDYKDHHAITEVIKFEILPSAIKRRVRRSKDRLDESFLAKTKDNRLVRIKPMMLTIANTRSSVKRDLRSALRRNLVEYLNNTSYEDVVADIVGYKLQKELAKKLRNIYPLKNCEIRKLELTEEDKRKNRNILTFEKIEQMKVEDEDEDSSITEEDEVTSEEEAKPEEEEEEAVLEDTSVDDAKSEA
ncbi:hypothetical protein COV93_03705 [Candidatus Woesearchaeota archaeon CG11_big_fil_rev_8_21_14_0_20_43_8]|nr:MAG: hypothetical protein COV93_03705 [Candidatus Woesearchaeota archaeon CG11_big_fil_rev_8_21_14_0_20_43_8]PIO05652.1 MAG: hypothetical protein COT47_03860 [Candidatus Woesearchaeota archaeon CG08_land_8_20_14_0_20_43_7]